VANNAPRTPVPLIMTRPRSASQAFLDRLPAPVCARFRPIISPLIEIVSLDISVALSGDDGVIFSSANGVQAAPDGDGRAAFCVGSATTRVAQQRGWAARQSGTDADSLIATLIATRPARRLVHLSGLHTRGDIAARLSAAGLLAEHIALYDQRLCGLTPEAAKSISCAPMVVVPLFSPRTAAQFAHVAPRTSSVHAVAFSPAVAGALDGATLSGLTIATHPNAQAMGAALANLELGN